MTLSDLNYSNASGGPDITDPFNIKEYLDEDEESINKIKTTYIDENKILVDNNQTNLTITL